MAKTQNERAIIDLVINGQQAKTSLKEVSLAVNKMRAELAKMHEADNPALYQKKVAEINKMISAQREMTARINDTSTAWGRFKKEMATVATGVVGGNVITAGLQFLVGLIPQAIEKSMKLKDQLADISKATDMTDQEVKELNSTLKTFDTRTATKDLRDMAVVAGQFGIAKEEIADFVKSADMLNVALGDQFQGAEQTAGTMLTLRNTFQDIKSEQIDVDMLHIGNALNVLEADGAATATVMADFASRIGGVAIPMGMTSGQVLGLSAALQEMNVTAERGSTAVVDILNGMAKAPEAFAKYARSVDGSKLSSKDFAELLNKDMYGALMAVVRGFKDGDTSATGMARKMADMGLQGNGAIEIFMKLASNTALVEDKITKAGEAIGQTGSITGEFNKKNHEMAVNLKKLGEWFSSFMSAGWLTSFAEGLATVAVRMLGLNDNTNKLTKSFFQQKEQVEGLDKQLQPLLDKHDKLKEKSKLSHTEQLELNRITQQIAKIMPGAASQFDEYGRAIAVSTDKARDLLDVQRQLLKTMNKEAIAEQNEQLRRLGKRQDELAQQRKTGQIKTVSSYTGEVAYRKLTQDEMKQVDKEIAQRQTDVQNTLHTLKELEGNSTDSRRDSRRERLGGPDKIEAPTVVPVQKEETEKERAARLAKEKREAAAALRRQNKEKTEEDTYEKLIAQARQRTAQIEEDSFTKQQLRFGENYKLLFEKAEGNKERMAEITQLMYDELAAIQAKEDERLRKEQEKKMAAKLKAAEEELEFEKKKKLAEIAISVANGDITKEQGDEAKLKAEEVFLEAKKLLNQAHFDSLLELYKDFADKKETLENEKKSKSTEIEGDITTNQGEQATARKDTDEATTKSEKDTAEKAFEHKKKIFKDSTIVLKTYFSENTIAYKAAFAAQQAYALAEVAINYKRSVMAAIASAAGIPFPGNLLAIAKSIAIPTLEAASAVASIRSQKFAVPGFADGGFSNPSGFVGKETMFAGSGGPFIAGEAGTEFIINNRALSQPVVANFARMLDGVQKSGNYNAFASMSSGASGGGSTTAAGLVGNGMTAEQGMMIIRELQANRMQMDEISKRPVMQNFRLFEEYSDNVTEVRQSNTL